MKVPRRSILKNTVAAGGGLLLGFPLNGASRNGAAFAPNAFIRIAPDGRITFLIGRTEFGQGVFTSLSMMIAEELEVDLAKVEVRNAPADPAYDHPSFGKQMTGGSQSVMGSWQPMRMAGAVAREMLVRAAAARWKAAPESCRAERGVVLHTQSGRRLSYGELASAAARQPVPREVALKPASEWKVIGRPMPRVDGKASVEGRTEFGIDVTAPGMLTALIARPPAFGARVRAFRAAKALAVAGVRAVVPVDAGVAVVASGFWSASRGLEALEVDWTDSPLKDLTSDGQRAQYAALARTPGKLARNIGDADAALRSAARVIEAEYEVPYVAHAMMEPLNCVADVRADRCDVWTGTQYQSHDRESAALAAGLPLDRVQLHTLQCGTGFGRRWAMTSYFVVEAVQLSKAVKAPVKVVWTREDDIRGGWYRPRYYHSMAGALDDQGALLAWRQRIAGQPIFVGSTEEQNYAKDGIDGGHTGGSNIAYPAPNQRVEIHMVMEGPPVQTMRAVGGTHNGFVTECFFDEMAYAAGRDPVEWRLELLKGRPRLRAALALAAEKAGWGRALPRGRGLGAAAVDYHTCIAEIAEVSVSDDGVVKVHRIVAGVDAGTVINPSGLRAQVEGGILFALSPTLLSALTVDRGRTLESNFHDFRVISIADAPDIEIHMSGGGGPPQGVGEAAVPCVPAAVANAVFAATGRRVRRLPIRPEDLRGWRG
ncbi:MAG: xanthine dehydrogenase family protein molybdopterin-binding subunit [Acidobacteria bacterium]|nr:xanthine dehydrogenase family protein molybdopterin-binding subunit [Acidobacteriota bacterium]